MKNIQFKENSEIILKLENVWKIYNSGDVKFSALKNINLNIEKGDFVVIIGASGSGKSTMMNLIGCLDVPSKGKIYLNSNNISEMSESDLANLRGKMIGFIFQQYNLIPSLSAFENVILPLEFLEYDDNSAFRRGRDILHKLGLSEKIFNRPNQLSGGQQQRVSIARCLVADPDIILADEPTGALDSNTGREVLDLLHNLWQKENKTIIMVTHDMNLAKYARTTVELKDGEIVRITRK